MGRKKMIAIAISLFILPLLGNADKPAGSEVDAEAKKHGEAKVEAKKDDAGAEVRLPAQTPQEILDRMIRRDQDAIREAEIRAPRLPRGNCQSDDFKDLYSVQAELTDCAVIADGNLINLGGGRTTALLQVFPTGGSRNSDGSIGAIGVTLSLINRNGPQASRDQLGYRRPLNFRLGNQNTYLGFRDLDGDGKNEVFLAAAGDDGRATMHILKVENQRLVNILPEQKQVTGVWSSIENGFLMSGQDGAAVISDDGRTVTLRQNDRRVTYRYDGSSGHYRFVTPGSR